jgi:hypothetical protein
LVTALENMIFEVAAYRGLKDDYILAKPPAWLLEQFERVQRARWRDFEDRVSAARLGTLQALAAAFGGQSGPALPDYQEIRWGQGAKHASAARHLPAWHAKFELANGERARRVATG